MSMEEVQRECRGGKCCFTLCWTFWLRVGGNGGEDTAIRTSEFIYLAGLECMVSGAKEEVKEK